MTEERFEHFMCLLDALNACKGDMLASSETADLLNAYMDEAGEAARKTFEEGGVAAALPSIDVPRSEIASGVGLAALFVRAGLASSNGEVRRAVSNNAISVNDRRVADPNATITEADLSTDGLVKLSHGRKKHVLLKPV